MKKAFVWRMIATITTSILAARPFGSAIAEGSSPIYGVTIADGYRKWELIAPSEEKDPLNELRVILGNAIAIEAYRKGTLPFPDGTILAKLGLEAHAFQRVRAGIHSWHSDNGPIHGQGFEEIWRDRGMGLWPLYKW